MNERLARRLDVMLWHGGRWWMDQPRGYSHRRGYIRVAAGRCGTPLAMATPAMGTGQPLSVGMLGPSTGLFQQAFGKCGARCHARAPGRTFLWFQASVLSQLVASQPNPLAQGRQASSQPSQEIV